MPPTRRKGLSLRDHFLLIVLFAAVLPLTAIGLWLTSAAARAGEELRRGQLRHALAHLEERVGARWELRQADLLWLAENELVREAMSREPGPVGGAPPGMDELLREAGPGLVSLRYLDAEGGLRWEVIPAGPFEAGPNPRSRVSIPSAGFAVRIPIPAAEGGGRVGELEAHLLLNAVLPADTLAAALQGVALAVLDGAGSVLLAPDSIPAGELHRSRFSVGKTEWLAESAAVERLPLRLVLAAPREPFTAPFERAARTGMLALLLVGAVALVVTAALTTRLTRNLRRLAAAADAVAAGYLDQRVDATGDDEVGRVGGAFNTMTESLRRTLDQLAERRTLAAVGELAASLSHEIRNAHTSVRLDLQRARRKIPDGEPAGELVERALGQVERLNRTVAGSLRVARSGRIASVTVDLRDPLRAALDTARAEAGARGVSVQARLPDHPIHLRGDVGALEHLFLNLLLNAVEASPGESAVEVEAQPVGAEARIRIRDHGGGIPAIDFERVFETFYSTKTTGTGLGLAIARSIAEAHGGGIALRRAEGGGVVALISLPLSPPPPAAEG